MKAIYAKTGRRYHVAEAGGAAFDGICLGPSFEKRNKKVKKFVSMTFKCEHLGLIRRIGANTQISQY